MFYKTKRKFYELWFSSHCCFLLAADSYSHFQ